MWTVKVPKAMRDDPKEIARYIADQVRARHGSGGKSYSKKHFMATYSGVMYEEDDRESGKMGKGTFGTYASRSLGTVERELQSRIAALAQGETPRQQGPASAYGYFANGVSEVSIVSMEEAEEIDEFWDKDPVIATYEGANEIDGEPYLDFRAGQDLVTVPARLAHHPKLHLGLEYSIDKVARYSHGAQVSYHWEIEENE